MFIQSDTTQQYCVCLSECVLQFARFTMGENTHWKRTGDVNKMFYFSSNMSIVNSDPDCFVLFCAFALVEYCESGVTAVVSVFLVLNI